MTGMGKLLEKERLEQGLTLEEMSARTMIKPQFLQAIEAEEYHELPGEAYVKPFIRTYAKALGLDDQLTSNLKPPEPLPEVAVTLENSIRERRERSRKARRRRFIFRLIAMLIVVIGSVYLFFKLLNV